MPGTAHGHGPTSAYPSLPRPPDRLEPDRQATAHDQRMKRPGDRLTDQAGDPAEQPEMRQVIPGGEDEQSGKHGQSGAEAILQGALR